MLALIAVLRHVVCDFNRKFCVEDALPCIVNTSLKYNACLA